MTFDETIQSIKDDARWRENPYFVALRDGTFSRDDFVETQIQFYSAVVFFSRPMSVLAARLPHGHMRVNILDNVHEEHGEGDLSGSHASTFQALLGRLGVSMEDVDRRAMWPAVRAFNTSLSGACLFDDTVTAVGVMGMIEDLFAEISGFIGRQIVSSGWLPADQIVHYAVHETLDEEHSREFYDIVAPFWDQHARYRYHITQGLRLGAYLFMSMYEGLYRDRGLRRDREVTGAHSMAADGFLPPDLL